MKKYRVVLAIAVIVLAVTVTTGFYMYNKKPADISMQSPDVRIMAGDLIKAFDENETTANARYSDKILAVSGKVKTVEADTNGQVTVFLQTDNPLSGITCSFYEKEARVAQKLKPGDEVTVKGMCTGKLIDVVLNKCSLEN